MSSATFQILVGIDFSDSSGGAMYHALALADRLGATLHLAYIAPNRMVAATDLGLNVPPEFEDAQEARQRLEHLRATLGGKVPIELHVRMGDAVQGLVDIIRELRPDMAVVGSHGRSAVMKFLLGSVSTQLLRLSPVPVLVVPAPGREAVTRLSAEPVVEPALPSVGTASAEQLDTNRTNDSNSGSVNVAPAGAEGYDVNPELRVRY